MHAIIGDPSQSDHTEAIALVAPYIDTIELSSRRSFPSPLLRAIKKNSGSMILEVVRDRTDRETIWYHLIKINQPSRYLPSLLQWYHVNLAGLSVYRLHLALDVIDIAD